MKECIFCKIANKEIGSKQLYEDDRLIAILDINPKADGHTLVIPKDHYEDYTKLDDTILEHLMVKVEMLAKSICEKLDSDGYSLVINYGSAQEIKHFHMHIIPTSKSKKVRDVDEVFEILTN